MATVSNVNGVHGANEWKDVEEARSLLVPISRRTGESCVEAFDFVSLEEPLEIRLSYGPRDQRQTLSIAMIMRTPGKDRALAAGFLFTEGVIDDPAWISNIADRPEMLAGHASILIVELTEDARPRIPAQGRSFYVNSGCGVCGKPSLASLRSTAAPAQRDKTKVSAELLYQLPAKLHCAQQEFSKTGGLHAIALFDSEGALLRCSEDVGRHNAMDKVIGEAFLEDQLPCHDSIFLLSGRASFELLQKSVRAGVSTVAAIGAPSSMAVRIAQEFDITLVGFLNEERFNVYHGKERIMAPSQTLSEPLK